MPDFQITTRGIPAKAEEWLMASRLPESELPRLNDEDRKRARLRQMTDEQFGRHLVLRESAKRREREEANRIGCLIEGLLAEFGPGFKLNALVKRGLKPGWHALIEKNVSGRDWYFDVHLPTEEYSGEGIKQVLNAASPDTLRNFLFDALQLDQGQRAAS